MRKLTQLVTLVGAISSWAYPAPAQVEVRSRAMEITLTGRLHAQFTTTSVDGERTTEFLIRRARFTADVRVSDLVSGRIQPDYGEGEISLKDAYVRLTFSPALRATFGQQKRPFDLFELRSSTEILVIERVGGINGVSTCMGPGGICSFSQLTEKLQYSDRDIGFWLEGQDRTGRFRYMASITNGAGANVADENGTKSLGGRVTILPTDRLAIAGNVGVHDYVDPASGNEYAVAFGGDVEYGDYSQGLHIQAGVAAGDNWQNLTASGPSTFVTVQGIVTYKHPIVGNRYVSHVEPVGRISWGEPDTDVSDDAGWLFTPGFVIYFTGRNKIAANVDIWTPSTGSTEWSLKMQTYLHF